jgi:hypothetical protein
MEFFLPTTHVKKVNFGPFFSQLKYRTNNRTNFSRKRLSKFRPIWSPVLQTSVGEPQKQGWFKEKHMSSSKLEVN